MSKGDDGSATVIIGFLLLMALGWLASCGQGARNYAPGEDAGFYGPHR